MKYLVCRKNLLRPGNSISSSDFWPMVVDMPMSGEAHTSENILRTALDSINEGYTPSYEYVIVPMHEAQIVSIRPPKPQYEVHVRRYTN